MNAARWHAKQDHIYQPIAFTHDGKRLIGGYSKFKVAFDEVMLADLRKIDRKAKLPGWVVHDLRRTARSLMSRAGVPHGMPKWHWGT